MSATKLKRSHTPDHPTTATNPAELDGYKAREKDNPLPINLKLEARETRNPSNGKKMADLTQPIGTGKV